MNKIARIKGSALITSLFIMTLISIIVTAMTMHLSTNIYRTNLSITQDQQQYAAQAIKFWAITRLSDPKQIIVTKDPEGIVMTYPEKFNNLYPNIKTTGYVIDLQSRFNINNLKDPLFRIFFYQLVKSTQENVSNERINSIIYAIINWIMPYQPSESNAAVIASYLKKTPSYLPAAMNMQDISELKLIHGVTPKIYQGLEPYLTALPEVLPINLNTAPRTILMSLGNGLNESQANELLKLRTKKGINNFHTIKITLDRMNVPSQQVTSESHYFLVVATATNRLRSQTYYTILKRYNNKRGMITINIIREIV